MNGKSGDGEHTPLHIAAMKGYDELAWMLVDEISFLLLLIFLFKF